MDGDSRDSSELSVELDSGAPRPPATPPPPPLESARDARPPRPAGKEEDSDDDDQVPPPGLSPAPAPRAFPHVVTSAELADMIMQRQHHHHPAMHHHPLLHLHHRPPFPLKNNNNNTINNNHLKTPTPPSGPRHSIDAILGLHSNNGAVQPASQASQASQRRTPDSCTGGESGGECPASAFVCCRCLGSRP